MLCRTIRNAGLTLSGAVLLAVVTAGQAGAITVPAAGTAAAVNPSCARVDHSSGYITQTVKVTNNCSYTVSFSVRRQGPDSPCYIVRPGGWRTYKWANGLNYQGIRWNCS